MSPRLKRFGTALGAVSSANVRLNMSWGAEAECSVIETYGDDIVTLLVCDCRHPSQRMMYSEAVVHISPCVGDVTVTDLEFEAFVTVNDAVKPRKRQPFPSQFCIPT